jgi:hypothetical protein
LKYLEEVRAILGVLLGFLSKSNAISPYLPLEVAGAYALGRARLPTASTFSAVALLTSAVPMIA